MLLKCLLFTQNASKCSQYRFKAFQNEIKNLILNFDKVKRLLIGTEFGKFGSNIRLNCQLSLNFGKKTQIKVFLNVRQYANVLHNYLIGME